MHGRAHFFIGGDVQKSTAAPNGPHFFLLQSEVDRLWAAWQENNLQSGEPAGMADYGTPGYPRSHVGARFNVAQIDASKAFDCKNRVYTYASLLTPAAWYFDCSGAKCAKQATNSNQRMRDD
jgi:hypothetical protein